MDKKQIVMLLDKLIERQISKFYNEHIKPDIEEMIKNADKKEVVKSPVLSDKKNVTNTSPSLLSIMEDDDLPDDLTNKKNVVESTIPKFKKKPIEFNTKNEHLNNILAEMASDPSKYRVIKENEAMVAMSGQLSSTSGDEYQTLSFNSDMVNANSNPIANEIGYSLEDVKTAVTYQSGNPEVAGLLIKDYSGILKKSKEISKSKGR